MKMISFKTFNPGLAPWQRYLLPLLAGFAGSGFLAGLYFSIMSWTESPAHAIDFFWQERRFMLPLILGFGIQVGLYIVMRLRLFVPVHVQKSSGAMTGASGAASTAAMVACCAHHVTDLLPVLGMSAAAAFLAEYQKQLMGLGLAATWAGIALMLIVLLRERRKAVLHAAHCSPQAAD
jgi:P-type Cu+ transporter